jgi:hypothetical protein
MQRQVIFTLSSMLLIALLSGCPRSYEDLDKRHLQAGQLKTGVKTMDMDGLDVSKGDIIDWKYVVANRTGQAKLRVDVGDLFARAQGVFGGRITVKNTTSRTVASSNIVPGQQTYWLEWRAEKDTRFYISIWASKGRGPYSLYFVVQDGGPCSKCDKSQFCSKGKCMAAQDYDPPPECDDNCGKRQVCVAKVQSAPTCMSKYSESTCQSICKRIIAVSPLYYKAKYWHNPKRSKRKTTLLEDDKESVLSDCVDRCKARKLSSECLAGTKVTDQIDKCESKGCSSGKYWSRGKQSCVRCPSKHSWSARRDRCIKRSCAGVRCPASKRCRRGRCVAKNPCAGVSCPSGQKCKSGRCIAPPPEACGGRCKKPYVCNNNTCVVSRYARGRILYVTPKGASSIITINRGKVHFLKRGMTGSVKGKYKLKVLKVFGLQCKAIVYTSAANLTKGMGVRITRR